MGKGMKALFVSAWAIMLVIGINACKKGGPIIPYDVPWPTATPVRGAIMAGVIDDNIPMAGVTVHAVDPFGTTLTSVTDSFGLAAFNPEILSIGEWTMIVPTQGKYYESSEPLTITGGGENSVTFRAGDQTISATPITSETYGSSNTDIVYNIVYDQPYNLKVPVVLSTEGLPAGWGKNFQPATIGMLTNSSSATITKNGCTILDYQMLLKATNLFDDVVDIKTKTVARGYLIPISLTLAGGITCTTTISCPTASEFNVQMSANNDCSYSYDLNVLVTGGAVTYINQTSGFINGSSKNYSFDGNGCANSNKIFKFVLTGPISQYAKSITFGCGTHSLNTTLFDSSY